MKRYLLGLFASALLIAGALSGAPAFAQGASCPIADTVAKVITTTPYTVLLSDQCKLLVFNSGSSVAVTLPRASTTFPAGFKFSVADLGAGTVTITPTTSTINGTTSVSVAQSFGLDVYTDATNYYTQSGGAPGGSGSFNTVTFGASSTIGGTLSGGTTAATIAATGAAGNLIIGTADQSGGVYLGGGATTVGNAGLQVAPGSGTIINQFVVTPTATGSAPTFLAGGSLKDAAVGAIFGTGGTGTIGFETSAADVQFQILRTASAVNNLTVTGSTGTAVVPLSAAGSGATIPIGVFPKGASLVALAGTTVANASVQVNTVASSVDFISVSGDVTATHAPVIAATGTDAAVTLQLQSKGAGVVAVGGTTPASASLQVSTVSSSVNFVTIAGAASGANPAVSISTGSLVLGTGSELLQAATTGFILVPGNGTGKPSGTPVGNGLGAVPMSVDVVTPQVCFYINGTGWKCAALS